MSKQVNIITGERFMTEGNALRHYVVKGRKVLKNGDYQKMKEVWNQANKILNPNMCGCCSDDDIGYCGLRHSSISEEEKFIAHCFPSFLKAMEKEAKF